MVIFKDGEPVNGIGGGHIIIKPNHYGDPVAIAPADILKKAKPKKTAA